VLQDAKECSISNAAAKQQQSSSKAALQDAKQVGKGM
jgi:hypothetical protein